MVAFHKGCKQCFQKFEYKKKFHFQFFILGLQNYPRYQTQKDFLKILKWKLEIIQFWAYDI